MTARALDLKTVLAADPEALAAAAADWILALALAKPGRFSLCLSGGSTPKRLYSRLAKAPYLQRFPWDRTHFFWGDERFVPPTDPLSNYKMVDDALLSKAPIPPQNLHPMTTLGVGPEEEAKRYEKELQSFYGADELKPGRPLFDVTLLGLGPDGHTASLFPGTQVLEDKTDWVAAVIGAKAEARLTLTYPTLESSQHTAFLVAGEDKQDILRRYRQGEPLPSTRLHPEGGTWVFCDQAANGPQP